MSAPGTPTGGSAGSDLQQRRDRLAGQLVELQWDLGGIAYEMAIRDHFRLDVLRRQAAKLQQVDAELAEVERMLRLDQAGAAGACGNCGALYARGSVYCWQCGKGLMPQAGVTSVPQ
jgi:hypothetical protein